MPLVISPVEPSDWDIIGSFTVDAMHGVPAWDIDFPYPPDAEGKKTVIRRLRDELKDTDERKSVKTVDEATGEIISVGTWGFYTENPFLRDPEGTGVNATEDAEVFGDDTVGRAHSHWINDILKDWRKRFQLVKGPHCHLKFCVTDPKKERRGGASALIKWGTDQADALGAPCLLYASEMAYERKVYHKHGFIRVADLFMQDQMKFPGRPSVNLVAMYRPAPGEQLPKTWPMARRAEGLISVQTC